MISPMAASREILGALFIDPQKVLPIIRKRVSPEDFDSVIDQALFRAAVTLHDNDEVVDPVTILEQAQKDKAEVSPDYVRYLFSVTPTATNVREYCDVLINQAARRRLYDIANDLLFRIESLDDIHDTGRWARDEITAVAERTVGGGIVTSEKMLSDFYAYRTAIHNGTITPALSTGYDKLDALLGHGLVNEGFYVLAARPGRGKTTLALNIAERVAAAGNKVLFISLEMSRNQLASKRVAADAGLSSNKILNSRDTGDVAVWQKISASIAKLQNHNIIFNKAKSFSVSDVEKLAQKIDGLGLVVIDYLGLLKHTEGRTMYEKVTATSNALKRMARSLGAPVLCLAQLNRESEKTLSREPNMADLRDSGAIEQDADGIIILHRYDNGQDEVTPTTPVSLKVSVQKNRHGATGYIDLTWYLINGRII